MWQAIQAASWANIWAAISAISTTLAVVVAAWAMLRWSKQDELKAKLDFKKQVCSYSNALATMPEIFTNTSEDDYFIDKIEASTKHYVTCCHLWITAEHTMKKNHYITKNFKIINDNHVSYITGKVEREVLLVACRNIMRSQFVFK